MEDEEEERQLRRAEKGTLNGEKRVQGREKREGVSNGMEDGKERFACC